MISKRLQNVVDTVEKNRLTADIGCDHGYTAIALVKKGIAENVLATDISEGSCQKAQNNITDARLNNRITVYCGNGLEPIKNQRPEAIVISGMGGTTMSEILLAYPEILKKAKQLILQPQKDIYKVRKLLYKYDFEILSENVFKDEGKIYFLINAKKGNPVPYTETEYIYGKLNILNPSEAFKEYMEYEYNKFSAALADSGSEVSENLKKKADCAREVYQWLNAEK